MLFRSNQEERKKIESETKNCYFWFNEIPIYEKNKFLEFIKYINYTENHKKISWENFDFLIYGYFLILMDYAKISILDINSSLSFLESQKEIDTNKFEEIFNSYNPMWIMKSINNMKNCFMEFHKDR